MHLILPIASALSMALFAGTGLASDSDDKTKAHAAEDKAHAAEASHGEAPHWTYQGPGGPANWDKVSPEFAMCGAGKMQSPIDLASPNARASVAVDTHYHAAPLTILNNGHTVQVNFPKGSTLASSGAIFNLIQVHFHTPSEHAIAGKRYPLVAHFVHATGAGALGVLAVFFEEGAANPELQKIVDHAPHYKANARTFDKLSFDANGLLPGNLDVYRYMGSLTTPPCTEGVNWHLAQNAMTASVEQLAAMRHILGDNTRPVQPLNNRLLVAR